MFVIGTKDRVVDTALYLACRAGTVEFYAKDKNGVLEKVDLLPKGEALEQVVLSINEKLSNLEKDLCILKSYILSIESKSEPKVDNVTVNKSDEERTYER